VFPFNEITDFKIDISEEQELFRKAVREFAENELANRVMEIEKTNEIPEDLIERAIKLGSLE